MAATKNGLFDDTAEGIGGFLSKALGPKQWKKFLQIWNLINIIALTGVIGILAIESSAGAGLIGSLPSWFGSYVFVSGFAFLAVTEGFAAGFAVVNAVRFGKNKEWADLIVSLLSLFGSLAACAGSILLATGVAVANPVAALAVSGLFIGALTLIALKSLFTYFRSEAVAPNNTDNTDEETQKKSEKRNNLVTFLFTAALAGFGIAALVGKLAAVSTMFISSFWLSAGIFGVGLILVAALVIVFAKIGKANSNDGYHHLESESSDLHKNQDVVNAVGSNVQNHDAALPQNQPTATSSTLTSTSTTPTSTKNKPKVSDGESSESEDEKSPKNIFDTSDDKSKFAGQPPGSNSAQIKLSTPQQLPTALPQQQTLVVNALVTSMTKGGVLDGTSSSTSSTPSTTPALVNTGSDD
jgi:hypothetical protein